MLPRYRNTGSLESFRERVWLFLPAFWSLSLVERAERVTKKRQPERQLVRVAAAEQQARSLEEFHGVAQGRE